MKMRCHLCSLIILIFCFLQDTDAQKRNTLQYKVHIHELTNPDGLNPLTSTGATSKNIQERIFLPLMDYDPKTLEMRPYLAAARPTIESIDEGPYKGGSKITYEIRKEAYWDNKAPILAHDFIFTLKAIKNPLVNAGALRPYIEFIHDVKIDADNPKIFTIYSKKRYFMSENVSGNLYVLPEYNYDPDGHLQNVTLPQLTDTETAILSENEHLKAFAENFSQRKYSHEGGFIVGGGAYELIDWYENDKIVLSRKSDWWGDKVKAKKAPHIQAHAPKLIYKIIPDMRDALYALQRGELDVMTGIEQELFQALQKEEDFTNRIDCSHPMQFSYYYIAFNMNDPKLNDPLVRRALAHTVDRKAIMEKVCMGLARETNGPIHPTKSYYHDQLEPIVYDLDKAIKLLEEAGWEDLDGDGIREKEIGGKIVSMRLKFTYNVGNSTRKQIGEFFKDAASKIGVEVTLEALEWSIFLDQILNQKFQLCCLAWAQNPGEDDLKQIWHTASLAPNGSNFTGFGTAESDQIIDELRTTLDESKRKTLYLDFQELIQEQQPYIFLFIPHERILISKRFENIETSVLNPGFEPHLFQPRKE